jgi:hypothetical protein
MKATKKQLFEMFTARPLMFGSLGAKILGECENARELKANLDYYLEKYECLASQSSERKYFHGKLYLTTQESARRLVNNIKSIISFMQWEDDKTFVNSMQWNAEKMSY